MTPALHFLPNFGWQKMASAEGAGKWTTKDPIDFGGGDLNLLSYALTDPISFVDPNGKIVPLIAAGAFVGSLIGGGAYALHALITGQEMTWGGLAGSVLAGAVAGGIGVVAPALAGSLGLGNGAFGAAIINAGAGALSAISTAALDPCVDLSAPYLVASMAGGAFGGYFAGKFFQTIGMKNFSQVGFPRTVMGVIPKFLGGNAGPNAINAIYSGGSVSVATGSMSGIIEEDIR